MDDKILKFLIIVGIILFAAFSIGVFLFILKATLHWLPEISIMGITMTTL